MPSKLPDSMHWQIYQSYLSGPPDPVQQQRQLNDLSEHTGQLKAQLQRLRAEVSELRGRNFQLGRKNVELEALLVQDSHNPSRLPSTDLPRVKTHPEPGLLPSQGTRHTPNHPE